jgi:hypothetical protein
MLHSGYNKSESGQYLYEAEAFSTTIALHCEVGRVSNPENISNERMPAERTAVNDGSRKKLCKSEATGEPRRLSH